MTSALSLVISSGASLVISSGAQRSREIYYLNLFQSPFYLSRVAIFCCFIETTKNISPHFYVSCPAFGARVLTWAHEIARIWTFVRWPCHCFPLLESRPRTLLQCTAQSFSITDSLYTAQGNRRNSRNPRSSEHKSWYRRGCICTQEQCTAQSFSITDSLYTAQGNRRNSRNPRSSEHKSWYRRGCICTQEQCTTAGGEAGPVTRRVTRRVTRWVTGPVTGRVAGYGGHA